MTTTKTKQKWHGACIYKVREVLSPTGKTFRGFRFLVAVPNMNGVKPFSSTPAASFSRPHMIFQSSDWCLEELEGKIQGAIRFLLNRGFTSVEPAETYEERVLTEMNKGRINHVEREET